MSVKCFTVQATQQFEENIQVKKDLTKIEFVKDLFESKEGFNLLNRVRWSISMFDRFG
jgi:hypothetical protein